MSDLHAKTDFAALRRAAEKATPGPWIATRKSRNPEGKPDEVWTEGEERFVAECYSGLYAEQDAAFIALCDPKTVVALCDEIERLRNQSGYLYALRMAHDPQLKEWVKEIQRKIESGEPIPTKTADELLAEYEAWKDGGES